MVLDKEEDRKLLLDLIANSAFSGKGIDSIFRLKQAIVYATVPPTEVPDDKG